jgi:hypothetical protein
MTLAESLAEHYIDAGRALDDGVVKVNGEVQFSAHRELSPRDQIEVFGVLSNWIIPEVPEVPDVPPSEECE